jgi:hypothetical protein
MFLPSPLICHNAPASPGRVYKGANRDGVEATHACACVALKGESRRERLLDVVFWYVP